MPGGRWRALLLGAMAGCAFVSGAASPADRAEALRLLKAAEIEGISVESTRANVRAALDLLPGHPSVQLQAAVLLAAAGDTGGAIEVLRDYVAAGLVAKLENAPELASLRDLRAWPELLEGLARNRQPVEAIGRVEVQGGVDAFFAEGLGLDGSGGFWVSSYRTGKLALLNQAGEVQAVFDPPAGHGGLFGMKWDPGRRLLWVGSGWHPVVERYRDRGDATAGILAFDPGSGNWLREILPSSLPSGDRLFGDLCLLPSGALLASESTGAALYRWNGGKEDRLEPWIRDGLLSPQGVVFDQDAGVLFIADYSLGILATRDLESADSPKLYAIGSDIAVCQQGVDGLYYRKGWLIAVQNGVRPMRVVAWKLDPGRSRIVEQRVLCANAAGMEEPTLGIVLGSDFWFVANSQWPRWSESGEWKGETPPERPVLLRVTLPD